MTKLKRQLDKLCAQKAASKANAENRCSDVLLNGSKASSSKKELEEYVRQTRRQRKRHRRNLMMAKMKTAKVCCPPVMIRTTRMTVKRMS